MYPLVMSVGLLEYYNDDDEEHNNNQHQHHNKQVTKYMENHICGVGCRCGYDAIFHDTQWSECTKRESRIIISTDVT